MKFVSCIPKIKSNGDIIRRDDFERSNHGFFFEDLKEETIEEISEDI